MKTKYRTVSDGYASHLQYLYEFKFLFFIPIRYWRYIWWPYYDSVDGRGMDMFMYHTYVCSHNNNLDKFVKEWPYIEHYFTWAEKEQKRLEDNVRKKQAEIRKKRNTINYLN